MSCPVCGHDQSQVLLAVCDVLVVKALEAMGTRLLRADRARFNEWPWPNRHTAHTRWPATDDVVSKAIRNAWDVIPAMLNTHGCCDVTPLDVTEMLDDYVHDLAVTGTPHTLAELHYRFESRLRLPVYVALREAAIHATDAHA